ncbi:MAG: hypothetical protein RLO01_01915 [Thalassobaculaceae bacterium]
MRIVPADDRLGRSDGARQRRIRALILVSKGNPDAAPADLAYLERHGLIEFDIGGPWLITDAGRAVLICFAANQNRHRAGS